MRRAPRAGALALVAFALALGGCQVELYAGVSEQEANEMVALLRSSDIEAVKVAAGEGLFAIRAPDEQFTRAVRILVAEGRPRRDYQSLADVFQGGGLIPTPFEERVRFIHGMSEELAHTVSLMDGVIIARVHIGLPLTGESSAADKGRAAVYIKHTSAFDFSSVAPQVKKLVSDSVAGLNYDSVEMLATPSYVQRRLAQRESGDAPRWRSFAGARIEDGGYTRLAVLVWGLAFGLILAALTAGVLAARLWRGRRLARAEGDA